MAQADKPTVLVTRRLPDAVHARLERDYDARLNPEDRLYDKDALIAAAQGADAILPCHTEHFTEDVFAGLPDSVKIIANFSVGYDHVDVKAAAKHGVVGLMRSYANQLAQHSIRVNTIHPTGVNTPMVVNDAMQEFLQSDPQLSNAMANALPVPMIEAVDLSNAILFLVSDAGRYVTGVTLPVDAGFLNKR